MDKRRLDIRIEVFITVLALAFRWDIVSSDTAESPETSSSASLIGPPGGPESKRPPLRFGLGTYQYHDDENRLHVVSYVNDHYGFRVLGDYTPYHPLDGVITRNSTDDDDNGDSSDMVPPVKDLFPHLSTFQFGFPDPTQSKVFHQLFPFYTNESVFQFGNDTNKVDNKDVNKQPNPQPHPGDYFPSPPYPYPFLHGPNVGHQPTPFFPGYHPLNSTIKGNLSLHTSRPFLYPPHPFFHPRFLPFPNNDNPNGTEDDLSPVESISGNGSASNSKLPPPFHPNFVYPPQFASGSTNDSAQPLGDYVKKLLSLPLPSYARHLGTVNPSLTVPSSPALKDIVPITLQSGPDRNVTYFEHPFYQIHPYGR